MSKLIKATGEVTDVFPANGKDFKLDECYKLLNCDMIEIQEITNGRTMIMDENGRHDEAVVNQLATQLWQKGRMTKAEFAVHLDSLREKNPNMYVSPIDSFDSDFTIVGDVIVCLKSEFR